MTGVGRKLRSGSEYSPFVLDLDFGQLLERVVPTHEPEDSDTEDTVALNYNASSDTSSRMAIGSATPTPIQDKASEIPEIEDSQAGVQPIKRRKHKTYKKQMARTDQYKIKGRITPLRAKQLTAHSTAHRQSDLDSSDLPATQDGYSGKNIPQTYREAAHKWTVEELLGQGFSLIKWDGW